MNKIEIQDIDIDLDYFFPVLYQNDPNFGVIDYMTFKKDKMLKIVYFEIIKVVLLKYGYIIHDNLTYEKEYDIFKYNIIFRLINDYDRNYCLNKIKDSLTDIYNDEKYLELINNIINGEGEILNYDININRCEVYFLIIRLLNFIRIYMNIKVKC